jgi:AraC family transcriptional regulator
LRFHAAGEVPPFVHSFTEICVHLRGATVVTRQANDLRQHFASYPGTIALCPAGVREDFIQVFKDIEEVLHIYLSPDPFVALGKRTSRDFSAETLRFDSGFQDPLIEHIAYGVLGELRCETSCGDLLVETLADSLAVRLLNNYSSLSVDPCRATRRPRGLDPRRLRRVVEYIHANLTKELTVEELASAASLSRFHFSRMFKAATGQSPSRFIGQQRLELAKLLLAEGRSIADVAHDCGFSSESNFVRSFRRATGLTPGLYRNRVRN